MITRAVLLASASVGTVLTVAPASAATVQPANNGVANANQDSSATNTQANAGEIIVTAQRRAENIQKVPISVTAVSADQLRNRGLNDLSQIAQAAPSLQINNNNNFSVRGIGTLSFSTALDTSVAVAVDDVNLGRPLLTAINFYDVGQVEVLNGPQGLLFGKNASAGLLNVTTVKPQIGKTSVSGDVEATLRDRPGSDAQGILTRLAVNIPVTADSALRVATLYTNQQPITRFVGTENAHADLDLKQYGIKAKYLWNAPGDNSVYLIGDYNKSSGVAGQFDLTYRSLGAGSPEAGPLASVGIVPGPDNLLAAGNAPFYRDLKIGGVQGTVVHTFPSGVAISDIAAWRFYKLSQQEDGDQAPGNGIDLNYTRAHYDQYSNELRVTLPAGNRLTGQAGLYYFKSKIDSTFNLGGNVFLPDFLLPTFPFCVGATVTPGGPPNCSVSNASFLGQDTTYTLNDESYAAFGQLTYNLSSRLSLIGGARVTHDRIGIHLVNDQQPYFVSLGASGVFDQRYSHTNLSWKVGAQYQATPDIMAYATYGQGYKGPGFNDVPQTATSDLTVYPETTKSFEAGVKTQFFDHRLTLNASAFHTKFLNYQSQSFNAVTQSFVVQNAASLTSQGIELGLVARPTREFTLNAQATFLDTKFDNYPGAQCYPGQPDTSCTATGTFNAGGLRAPLAPKFASSIYATYEQGLTPGLTGFVEGDLYHRSSIYYQSNHAPGTLTGSVTTLGASIGVHTDRWRASIFCKNCTNKVYPVNISPVPQDAGQGIASYYQTFDWSSVRTIGLRGSFQF